MKFEEALLIPLKERFPRRVRTVSRLLMESAVSSIERSRSGGESDGDVAE